MAQFPVWHMHIQLKLNVHACAQDIAQEARSLFGPDEILVDLEGPELISPLQTHLGGCKYAFFYKITIGGEYYLRIKVLREGYAAITETDHSFRQPYFDDVIGGAVNLNLGKVCTPLRLGLMRLYFL
jgi:hypothetical protein